MGVPKFFRYISERYPCMSELVKEYQIPEFDNLYLDMNGIIHMCSHPDDNNPHFRISEEKIIKDIFHYIEVLFRMIRPQKLFFMAVDGVAPRAKMNQQRGRRFRSAKDASKQEEEALRKGEKLPTEQRFDSNCITPGTVFMARLHEQLKYFVSEKLSNDPLWRNCKVVLSGHETPGEGEHKIMDYIRYMRAQPGYDPNTRHCLYGLDADLIMLGLCTHEPHFSLLREEVKFGRKNSSKRSSVPEEITFFLLHLSLMREYLELEFAPLKEKLQGFHYDFERIIDDWVLMGFLVGNDFIPHLPNLHITNGALPILYKAYMDILPTLNGYINESGMLNLERFEKFMQKLGELDLEYFEEVRDDVIYMESKTGRKHDAHAKVSSKVKELEEWSPEECDKDVVFESLEETSRDKGLAALIQATEDLCIESSDDSADTDEDDPFTSFKKEYYRNKLEYSNVTPEVMRAQAEGYVRAIQWNLNYYYNGVSSWSWYYPHHYAPYISDVKGFANLKIDFELGKPFKPYEQLLAVLPSASKNLLPLPYQDLMVNEESPIKKYYPEDFQTDLNGKRQEWEAVVLLPFLDESDLLEAMSPCNEKLSLEEIERNTHGPMLVYEYTDEDLGAYPAPEYFPTISHNKAKLHAVHIEDILVPKEKLVKGAYPGVKMDIFYPGFPTMKHLKFKADVRKAKVKVFEQPSRNESMIITVIPEEKYFANDIPTDLLDKCVFVNWPHLVEAKIVAISNENLKYISLGPDQYDIETRSENSTEPTFQAQLNGIVERYKNCLGIEVGTTKMLVHVKVMIGRRYMFSPNGRLSLEKQFSELSTVYPIQTIVADIRSYDHFHTSFRDIFEVFPEGTICFTLTNPYYGSQGKVLDSTETYKNGRLKLAVSYIEEPDFSSVKELENLINQRYKTLYHAASQVGMSNFLFSRITGSIYLSTRDGEGGLKNVAAGLDLKFNKKNKETPGYTRKLQNTWYYTDKAVQLVREFSEKFPEIFEYLKTEEKSFDDIAIERVFGDKWEERLKELNKWLKSIPTNSIERKTCGGMVVDTEIVQELEEIIAKTKNKLAAKKVTMQIKPSFLYKPELQSGTLPPDAKMQLKLFDRIVNVRQGFSVPFGLKGTIIGINEVSNGTDRDTMYDVLFDEPFKDGMVLNCSPGRGYRLPKTAFINISHGKRLMEEKTGKPADLIAKAEVPKFHPSLPQARQNHFIPMQVQRQISNPESTPSCAPKLLSDNWRTPDDAQSKAIQQELEKQCPLLVKDAKVQRSDNVQRNMNVNQQKYIQQQREKNQKMYHHMYLAQQQRMVHMQQQSSGDSQLSVTFPNSPQQRLPPNRQRTPQQGVFNQQNIPLPFQRSYSQQRQFEPSYPSASQQFVNSKYYQAPRSKPVDNQQSSSLGNQQTSAFAQFSSEAEANQKAQSKQSNEKAKQQAIQKGVNNFMPDFKRNERDGSKDRGQTVNTDFLKRILNIGDAKNKMREHCDRGGPSKPEQASSSNERTDGSKEIIKKKDEVSSAVSFEMFAEAAKAPASVRLLTYYQSNGLGLPRYQYFNSKASTYAQITLPNGELITGKPGKTREDASETVAAEALDLLIGKLKVSEKKKSDGLPVPPMSWVEPQKENVTPKQENKKTDSVVISNSMVPLQALRRQVSKNRNSDNKEEGMDDAEKVVKNKTDSEKMATESNKCDEAKPLSISNGTPKQKKERKTRIAANFQGLKK